MHKKLLLAGLLAVSASLTLSAAGCGPKSDVSPRAVPEGLPPAPSQMRPSPPEGHPNIPSAQSAPVPK
jgi:hypothetical protein